MSDIFISYRRADSAGDARSIYDRFVARHGRNRVFMDVDAIPAGVDFRKYLVDSIGACRYFIVMIGPRWIDAANRAGRRLDDPRDHVRNEIEIALEREKQGSLKIIPIILNGARMPRREELPQSLRPLSFRNAIDVRHTSFDRDVAEVIRNITLDENKRTWPRPGLKMSLLASATAFVLLLLGCIGLYAVSGDRFDPVATSERVIALVKLGDLTGARQLLEQTTATHPEAMTDRVIANAIRLVQDEEAEVARQAEITALMAKLDAIPPLEITDNELTRLIVHHSFCKRAGASFAVSRA